jgi:ribosomal protein S27E
MVPSTISLVEAKNNNKMPQIFYALRCFSCGMFQVVQQKKTNKWACKICQEKQVGQPAVRMCSTNFAHVQREIL